MNEFIWRGKGTLLNDRWHLDIRLKAASGLCHCRSQRIMYCKKFADEELCHASSETRWWYCSYSSKFVIMRSINLNVNLPSTLIYIKECFEKLFIVHVQPLYCINIKWWKGTMVNSFLRAIYSKWSFPGRCFWSYGFNWYDLFDACMNVVIIIDHEKMHEEP